MALAWIGSSQVEGRRNLADSSPHEHADTSITKGLSPPRCALKAQYRVRTV